MAFLPRRSLASFLLGASLAPLAAPTESAPSAGPHTRASLLAESDAVVPGQPLVVGIRLEMDEGWHTYWKNPGDSGLPTRVRWLLPDGFAAGEIRWPRPGRFATGPLVGYGYARDVLLPVEIRVPPAVAASEVRIAGRVDWLECREACLPGRAELSLVLPVRASASPGRQAGLFAETRRRLPVLDAAWRVSAREDGGVYRLAVRGPRGVDVREAYFYAGAPRVVDHGRPQALVREGAGHRLDVPRDPNGAPPDRLAGVLVAETRRGTLALDVDAPLAAVKRAD